MASKEHPQADGSAERMVQSGKLNEAVETLLNSEKQMRLVSKKTIHHPSALLKFSSDIHTAYRHGANHNSLCCH